MAAHSHEASSCGRRRRGAEHAGYLSCRVFGLLVVACAALLLACGTVEVVQAGSGAAGGAVTHTTGQLGGGGSGGVGGVEPAATRFVLGFVSDVPESIWADETDSAWPGHWLSILRPNGAAIRKAQPCEYCACDACPNCPICGAPCPTATEIASGESLQWEWGGHEYPTDSCPSAPQDSCMLDVVAPPGSYVARFCWGTSYSGTPPCPAEVLDLHCAEVPFQHPDPDGVVEYLVNNSG